MNNEFYIKFWGVRGTVPVVNKSFKKYGGNTSCVEVRCNGRQIILDAGTGIRPLGLTMDICDVDILLSHTHLDHIQGLPFFNPLHCKGSNVALWAGNLLPEHTLEKILHKIMTPPVFPLAMGDVYSSVEFMTLLQAIIWKVRNSARLVLLLKPFRLTILMAQLDTALNI